MKSEVTAIPPPPQYKGVHFAPQVTERRRSTGKDEEIPTEGLPTRPAVPKTASVETVAIQVRNNPVPLLSVSNKNSASAVTSFEQPLTSSAKVKALAASAAGCEIVFVNNEQ